MFFSVALLLVRLVLISDDTLSQRPSYVGRIYLARTDEGLVVKRAGKDADGGWLLTSESDAPEHAPIPWPADVETIGEVRWMAAGFP